jgi:rhodanese-related sulfurtransferase
MARFLEYLNNHPYLAGGTLLAALIALAFEVRSRALGATAISTNEAIALHNKGALVLDVRSPEEFATGHIVNARNITLETLANTLDSIKKYREKPVIVCCEAGTRSAQATKLLKAQGYTTVFNLSGGLAAWRRDNLPLSKPTGRTAVANKG